MTKFESENLIEKYLKKEKLEFYLSEVAGANKNFNLYSRNLRIDDLRIMAAESLIPVELGWIDGKSGPILDLGSGWGIPAIPLLLSEKTASLTLAERSQKKADFLILLLSRLKLKATVVKDDIGFDGKLIKYPIITLRRVAINERLVRFIKRSASDNAHLIYFGPGLPRELFPSAQAITYSIDRLPSRHLMRAEIFPKK
jgi:16S rRNA G527 N7-methylase RsmG